MTQTTVKKQRIGRIPNTETTIIDFDGISFALNEKQIVQQIADLSKALNGIYTNREKADRT